MASVYGTCNGWLKGNTGNDQLMLEKTFEKWNVVVKTLLPILEGFEAKKNLINFQFIKKPKKLPISHSNAYIKGFSSCSTRSKLTAENIDLKTIHSILSIKINKLLPGSGLLNIFSAESSLLKTAKSACTVVLLTWPCVKDQWFSY